MKIQLKHGDIINLSYNLLNESEKRDKNYFDLKTDNYFSDDKENNNTFGVIFNLIVKDKGFDLSVEAVYHFELIDEELTDEFKNSSFPVINAPAIAFPYLRAFISNFTLQAGKLPVILPSINFVEHAKQSSSKKQE